MADDPLTDDDIYAIANRELDAAETGDSADMSASRSRAMDYAYGDMTDTPSQKGRSKATTRTVRDTIGWILPGIMRVFFSSDEIADVVPSSPEDEKLAQQQADGLNYIFLRDCQGYKHLYNAFHDALLLRTGVVKFWWEEKLERTVKSATGLDEAALGVLLMENEGIEIIEVTPSEQQADAGLMNGQPFAPEQLTLYDVKYKRDVTKGKPVIACVPPEEFRINQEARSIEDARFLAHICDVMRGELIKEGYDRAIVDDLPKSSSAGTDTLKQEREQNTYSGSFNASGAEHHSAELITKAECYLLADRDGDGIPEWLQVCMAGGSGGRTGLAVKEWTDPVPFVEFTPDIVPHRREGLSVADHTMDIQQIGTVILRAALDNTYAQGNRQKVVVEGSVLNMDELINPSFNGVIRVKAQGDSKTAVTDLEQAFIATDLWQALQGLDDIVEKRTGVSRQSQSLDPQALTNQSATAANIAQTASYSKIELIARNFADRLEQLLRNLNVLMVTHQDKPRTIRMRGKWVSLDPRDWDADADIVINPGIGFGNRDREMAMLQLVLALQKEIVLNFGPQNPVVPPSKVLNTAGQIVRAAGLRNPERYFNDVPDEQLFALLEKQKQNQQNPVIEKAKVDGQAKVKVAEIGGEVDVQIADQKQKDEIALRLVEMAGEERLKMAAIKSKTDGPGDERNIRRHQ